MYIHKIKKPEDHMVLYSSPECLGYAEICKVYKTDV